MTPEAFLENFGHLADAPNGVQMLREMILQLAVQGKLVPQDPNDDPAKELLKEIEAGKERLVKEGKIKATKPMPEIKREEVPYALPQGWEWVRLGKLGIAQTGTTPPSKDRENYGPYIPFIGPGDIKNGKIGYTGEGLSEIGLTKGRLIKENSVLMVCIGGSIGKHAINDRDVTCNQQINTLSPYLPVSVKYVYWAMATIFFQDAVIGQASGSATPIINKQKWSSIPIPLPMIAEQHRIVAKVDQLMALCDELEERQQKQREGRVNLNNSALDALLNAQGSDEIVEHWQRICDNFNRLYDHPETIGKLRGSLLQLAFMGMLDLQKPDDEPVSILLEKIRSEKERLVKDGTTKKAKSLIIRKDGWIPHPLPPNWEWASGQEVFHFITSGSRGWAKYYSNEGSIFLRIGNLDYESINLDLTNIQRVSPPKGAEGTRTRVQARDILISITGDTGMIALIQSDFEEAYINQHIALARPSILISAEYVARFLTSPMAIMQFQTAQRGIKNSLSLDDIRCAAIPIPPLDEQKRIVVKVDQLMALCDDLEKKLVQVQSQGAKYTEAVVAAMTAA